jgi:hypothetical protein
MARRHLRSGPPTLESGLTERLSGRAGEKVAGGVGGHRVGEVDVEDQGKVPARWLTSHRIGKAPRSYQNPQVTGQT